MSVGRLVGILLLSASACGRAVVLPATEAQGTGATPECEGTITVAVSQGVTPRFTWTPDCIIRSLAVQTAGDRHSNLWVVNIPEPGGIRSGVSYGVTPAGSKVSVGPKPLRPGQHYMLTVRNITGGGGLIAAEGTATFRP